MFMDTCKLIDLVFGLLLGAVSMMDDPTQSHTDPTRIRYKSSSLVGDSVDDFFL